MNDVIGVAGCGTMGLPMAERLAQAGFEVWGFDVRPVAQFGAFRERMIDDPGRFAATCDIVVSVVRDARQTMDLCFDRQGLFVQENKPNTLVLSSTLSPRVVEACRARLDGSVALADAPMSGAPYRARSGELSFMLGGETAVLDRLDPLFRVMGNDIFRLGELGTGMTAKVLNNYCAATSVVATHRVLGLAKGLGLERRALLAVMRKSSGSNWFADNIDDIDWSNEGYSNDNTIAIIEKDVLSALDAAEAIPGEADADTSAFDDALLARLRELEALNL